MANPAGDLGMPRRISTYGAALGWDTLNLIISLGSVLFAAGTLLSVDNVVRSLRHGKVAGPDPWYSDTLEWAMSSPPPDQNFTAVPVVNSRHPLWYPDEMEFDEDSDVEATHSHGEQGSVTVTLFAMYWHFVDVVWIFVFASLYLTAHVR
ncbi:MAG: hypothetical protein ABIR68_09750 [Ilumatobacteraceae bacterium]